MKVIKFCLILSFVSLIVVAGTSVRNGENGFVFDEVEYLKSIKIESDLVKQTIECAFVLPDGLKFENESDFNILDSSGTIVFIDLKHSSGSYKYYNDTEQYKAIIKTLSMRFECKEIIEKFNYLSEFFKIKNIITADPYKHSFTAQRVLLDGEVILATDNYDFISKELRAITNTETINFSENFITGSSFLGVNQYDFGKLEQFLLLLKERNSDKISIRELTKSINLINIDTTSSSPFSVNGSVKIFNEYKLKISPTDQDLEVLNMLNEFSRNIDFTENYNMIANKLSPIHIMATYDTDIQKLDYLKDKFFEVLKNNVEKSFIIEDIYESLRKRFIWFIVLG